MTAIDIVGEGAGAFVEMPEGNGGVFPTVDHAIGTVEEVPGTLTKELGESNAYWK